MEEIRFYITIMVIILLLCVAFITEVTSWTVDLSEIQKFEDNGEKREENEVFYNYAESFGYQTFTEKKVKKEYLLRVCLLM